MMKVHILDDWFDTLKSLRSFAKLDGHDVTIWTDHTKDVAELAELDAPTGILASNDIDAMLALKPDCVCYSAHSETRMMEAAKDYYRVLQQANGADAEEVVALKRKLDKLIAPFSDDVAYYAFLEMERTAAGIGEIEG